MYMYTYIYIYIYSSGETYYNHSEVYHNPDSSLKDLHVETKIFFDRAWWLCELFCCQEFFATLHLSDASGIYIYIYVYIYIVCI